MTYSIQVDTQRLCESLPFAANLSSSINEFKFAFDSGEVLGAAASRYADVQSIYWRLFVGISLAIGIGVLLHVAFSFRGAAGQSFWFSRKSKAK